MSWLDDVPVEHDQQPYDPSQPIEREFVLAPAWRALKSRLSGILKRSDTDRAESPQPVEEFRSTARIFEPEPRPVVEPRNIVVAPSAKTTVRQTVEESVNDENPLSGIEKAGHSPVEVTASIISDREPAAEKRDVQEAAPLTPPVESSQV